MHDASLSRELDEAAAAFAKGELGPVRARALRSHEGGIDRKTWKALADMGWTGILVPQAYGGLGLGMAEMTVVARRLAQSILPEPLSACAVLATGALLSGNNESLKQSLLPAVVAGDLLPTVAWQERGGEMEPSKPTTTASGEGADCTLSGDKRFVPYGDVADGFIVSARAADGMGLYWVPAGSSGLSITTAKLADGSTQASVSLDGTPAQVLLAPASDLTGLAQAMDRARVSAAAELLGVATGSLDLTLEYLRTRSQFGKLIGSFQALQHRAVNLYVMKEFCQSAVDAAVAHFDSAGDSAKHAAFASRAKARCSDSALEIVRESIQMHGAIGWTDDCDLGFYVKRALTLSAWLGNAASNRRRFAALNPFEDGLFDQTKAATHA